jgi:CO dehydrogenase maturation factor
VGAPKTVAVAGKGGTGKTTLAGLLIREMVARGASPILAVDADPNANLGEILGTRAAVTVGGLREQAFTGAREIPAGWDKQTWIEYKMHEALEEATGYDLLVMGRPEGPGCYCYANNLLREYVKTLANEYAWVVMDNEGGLEHLSRHTTRDVDVMFIVTDASVRGARTVERISELADEMKLTIAERYVVVSRAPAGLPVDALMEHTTVPFGGVIPNDPALFENDLAGGSVFDLPDDAISLGAVRVLMEKYLGI